MTRAKEYDPMKQPDLFAPAKPSPVSKIVVHAPVPVPADRPKAPPHVPGPFDKRNDGYREYRKRDAGSRIARGPWKGCTVRAREEVTAMSDLGTISTPADAPW